MMSLGILGSRPQTNDEVNRGTVAAALGLIFGGVILGMGASPDVIGVVGEAGLNRAILGLGVLGVGLSCLGIGADVVSRT